MKLNASPTGFKGPAPGATALFLPCRGISCNHMIFAEDLLERARRFERPTLTLARLCSTPELRPLPSVRADIGVWARRCKGKNYRTGYFFGSLRCCFRCRAEILVTVITAIGLCAWGMRRLVPNPRCPLMACARRGAGFQRVAPTIAKPRTARAARGSYRF